MRACVAFAISTVWVWFYAPQLQAQSALVARVSEETQVATADQRHLAQLEADKTYWVVGCDDRGGYLVLHDSGLRVSLPTHARFHVIAGGKYEEATTLRVNHENSRVNYGKGEVFYEARLQEPPAGVFVAVQVYANGEPCGTGVELLTGKNVSVCVQMKAFDDDAKITYTAHYFLNGNELHQMKASSESW